MKSDCKRFTQKLSKTLDSEKKTNNIKEFYAMKFVDYQMKQQNNLQ